MTLEEIVSKFNTTPFLFVGSGMSRRYLSLPDWKGLLEHFANTVRDDEFSYSAYENRAKKLECKSGIMPKIAELIQKDFDNKWFADPNIRTLDSENLERVKRGKVAPFKAEVAAYLKKYTLIDRKYKSEVTKLTSISENSISGVITTNYDCFLENQLMGFTTYTG